jgi:hypothetical protein
MKLITRLMAFVAISFASLTAGAQKVKVSNGNPDILKTESMINIEFAYDNMSVGKYDREADYIRAKTDEYNKKEPGKGDNWATSWGNDKPNRYQPKFIELFTLTSGMTVSSSAKYTLVFHVLSIEPGYNIGISRKNAEIDAEIWIVETANRSNKLCEMSIKNVPGGTAFGYDFDSGLRISEAFANAGKKLAKYLK